MSRNETDLASLIADKASVFFFAVVHPRLPEPSEEHPDIPTEQGTEYNKVGICSFPFTVIIAISGKPSRFASPSLSGKGKGG